jgi:hypothetical protein
MLTVVWIVPELFEMRWVWESRQEAGVDSMSYVKHAVSWSSVPLVALIKQQISNYCTRKKITRIQALSYALLQCIK